MKALQVVPRVSEKKKAPKLKTLLIEKERELRGSRTTFYRKGAGRLGHKKYRGWIHWDETFGGILVAEIRSKAPQTEWQLLQAFVGYLDRHFAEHIESVTIHYR